MNHEVCQKIIEWFLSGYTGVSSKTIVAKAFGVTPRHYGYPRDPSDFFRCYWLLQKVPELRQYLPLLKEPFPDEVWVSHHGGEVDGAYLCQSCVWEVYVDHWETLEAIFEREIERGDGRMPELWQKMIDLRAVAACNR